MPPPTQPPTTCPQPPNPTTHHHHRFNRSTYVLKLLSLRDSEQPARLVRDAETRLLQHRRVVQDLEQRFRQAQEQLLISPVGYGAHQKAPQTPSEVMALEKVCEKEKRGRKEGGERATCVVG